jgi:hypothetical protein
MGNFLEQIDRSLDCLPLRPAQETDDDETLLLPYVQHPRVSSLDIFVAASLAGAIHVVSSCIHEKHPLGDYFDYHAGIMDNPNEIGVGMKLYIMLTRVGARRSLPTGSQVFTGGRRF